MIRPRAWLQVLRPRPWEAVLALTTLTYLVLVLLWQYDRFAAGVFAYHDLTIISDFFSNALVHGKPFWVTNEARSHFRNHFTPSLALLIPAFIPVSTQFGLIAIVATSVCLGIYLLAREQLLCLRKLGVPEHWSGVLALTCLAVFALNRYTLRVLDSGHFEPFYILAAALLLVGVRRNVGVLGFAALVALSLGVRQDAGFFLFFLLLSCLVAPAPWRGTSRRRLLSAAGACVAYVAVASAVIMPRFGNDGGTRFWKHWGDSWPEVFLAWLRSPGHVLAAVGRSEFFKFNAEFFFAHALNPIAWLANQAPAVLFYTADAPDKRHLFFYNASFLLPGVMLCFMFTQVHLAELILRRTRGPNGPGRTGFRILGAAFGALAVGTAASGPRAPSEQLAIHLLHREDPFAKSPLRELAACPSVSSISADFRSIVYVPFRSDKLLPKSASRADLVVVSHESSQQDTPHPVDRKQLLQELRERHFKLAGARDGYEFYLAPGVRCEGQS